jgi:hypothetical protein
MYDHVALNSYAKNLGADLVITGEFAPFEEGLGVSVDLFRQGHQEVLATSSGKLEFTEEMKQLPSPSPPAGASPDGVYLAGWAGVGMPRCLRCPDPRFPRGESGHGFVVLSAVIGADGLLRLDGMQVRVTTKASYTDAAIVAVKGWRFEPAKGPTGKPVAVRVPVEVTFR